MNQIPLPEGIGFSKKSPAIPPGFANPVLTRLASLIFAGLLAVTFATTVRSELLLFVGSYTGAKSKGIHALRMNLADGALSSIGLAAETKNPSFLALHPNGRVLYAVGEMSASDGQKGGAVSAFAIDAPAGRLTLLNQQSSKGAGPCHLAVDKTGHCLLVANYGSGSIAAFPIEPKGQLGEASAVIQHSGSSVNSNRQAGPHAHFIIADPANRFALTCDLGLDKVLIYRLDAAKASLRANDPPFAAVQAGSGPRHLAFHPKGRFVYVINEMASTLTAFSYDPGNGALKELETVSTLPGDFKEPSTTAEVEVHPSGKFVYGSNRGHDSIAAFAVDEKTGKLTLIEHQSTRGKTPRFFGIDPTGAYLLAANQNSDSIVVFRVDAKTGRLVPTGQDIAVGAPVCIAFVPSTRSPLRPF